MTGVIGGGLWPQQYSIAGERIYLIELPRRVHTTRSYDVYDRGGRESYNNADRNLTPIDKTTKQRQKKIYAIYNDDVEMCAPRKAPAY